MKFTIEEKWVTRYKTSMSLLQTLSLLIPWNSDKMWGEWKKWQMTKCGADFATNIRSCFNEKQHKFGSLEWKMMRFAVVCPTLHSTVVSSRLPCRQSTEKLHQYIAFHKVWNPGSFNLLNKIYLKPTHYYSCLVFESLNIHPNGLHQHQVPSLPAGSSSIELMPQLWFWHYDIDGNFNDCQNLKHSYMDAKMW